MISLSLYNGHNACICIMKDGEILLNWELERFSRVKHDYGFNKKFLEKSLELAGIDNEEDIDVILTNSLCHGRPPPWSVPHTSGVRIAEARVDNAEWVPLDGCPIIAMNHHLAHVASSYYTSPFDSATILTQDGGGDNGENFSIATAKGNKIIKWKYGQVVNVASWWSGLSLNNFRMPRIHEWDPGAGAGKLMALAAYGKTSQYLEDKLFLDMSKGTMPDYTDNHSCAYNNDEDLSDTGQQNSRNVAAALQGVTERHIKAIYDDAYVRYPDDNLCISGGLALNCVANTRVFINQWWGNIRKKCEFKKLHVPSFPNDSGLAVGMALYHWHHILDNPKKMITNDRYFSPYLGPKYSHKEIEKVKAKVNPELAMVEEGYTIDDIAEIIANENVICVWRGRSESGPRALGHRSIICLPSMKGGRDYLNSKVKNREMYRPYAPIILDKYVDEVLEQYLPVSPYMSTSGTIKEEWRDRMSACNHVDNSTRPQIIHREHDRFTYNLIEVVYEKTGIPAILNTSFNMQEPIVETPEEALNTFFKFPIKYLLLENSMITKL